jgi:hypothetical protein
VQFVEADIEPAVPTVNIEEFVKLEGAVVLCCDVNVALVAS